MKSKLTRIIGSIAFTTLLFLFSNNAIAQWHPIIGLKTGLNVDNLRSSPTFGANMGGYFAVEYKENWGLNVEAFYAERFIEGNPSRFRVTYLETPLYFSLFFLRKYTTIRPKIVIGTSLNFLLENDRPLNSNYNVANFELAGILGLGFNKDLTRDGHITMFLDARYMQGFTGVSQTDYGSSTSYNKTLRFHIGFGISLTGGRKGKKAKTASTPSAM
jgi:hypothetical protein